MAVVARYFGWILAGVGLASLAGVACIEDEPRSILQPADTAPSGKVAFSPSAIVDDAAFTDIETLDVDAVQRFLQKTPYDYSSFLDTYQSNGVRAADAIVAAARQYRINPLVFLVFSQISEGLIGENLYPFPVERAEYVFRCGCSHQALCRPEFAGFNRQVDCLGRALRSALDELEANKVTASGWGPQKATLTLEGVAVTPESNATAALYERIPRIGEGRPDGVWLFWNVWQLYAPALDYAGPVGTIAGRWIGEACASSEACGVPGGICATNYPSGICTAPCNGGCPEQPGKPSSFCAKFPGGGFCLPVCNPQASGCRKNYSCLEVVGMTEGTTQHVCSGDTEQSAGGDGR